VCAGGTGHLRSVARRRTPAGEGRSLSDSVLQRDKQKQKKTTDINWLRFGEASGDGGVCVCVCVCVCEGGKITQGVGRNLGCHISVLQDACSPQMFASNINDVPNKPLCSSLQLQPSFCIIQQRGSVCVCQFFRNQFQATSRSRGRAETFQMSRNGLMDGLMDSS